jgi:hypothetical protein
VVWAVATFPWKKKAWIFLGIHTVVPYVLHVCKFCVQETKLGPIIIAALIAHHTPTLTSSNMLHRITQEAVALRVPTSTEFTPSFTYKHNEHSVWISIIHSMKVTVPRIWFCVMIVWQSHLFHMDAVNMCLMWTKVKPITWKLSTCL